MYKNASLLLALAAAAPAWAQHPEPAPEAPPEIRVRLVKTGDDIKPEIEVVEEVGATLIRTGQDAAKADNRGYMGIFLNGEGEHVSVASVAKKSGAEAAGMKAGDVILRVGKKKIGSTDELLKALAGYAAGDSVTIQAKRGEEQILFKVKLGKRPSAQWQKSIAREIGVDHKGKLTETLRGLGYAGDDEDEVEVELEVIQGLLDPAELDIEGLDIKSFGDGQVKVLVQRKGHGGEMQLHEIHEGHGKHEGHEGHHEGDGDSSFHWLDSSDGLEGKIKIDFDVDYEMLDDAGTGFRIFQSEGGPHGMFKVKVGCDSEQGGKDCPKGVIDFWQGRDSDCGPSDCQPGDGQCEVRILKLDGKSGCGPSDCQSGDEDCEVRIFKLRGEADCDSGGCCAQKVDESDCHERKGHGKSSWRSILGNRSAPKGHGFQGKHMMGAKRGTMAKKLHKIMQRHSGEGHGMDLMREMHRMHGVDQGHGGGEFHVDRHPSMGNHGGTGEMIEAMHELRGEMHALREEIQELRGQVRRMKGNARQGASRSKRRSRKASRGIDAKVHTQTVIMTEDENGEHHIEVIKD